MGCVSSQTAVFSPAPIKRAQNPSVFCSVFFNPRVPTTSALQPTAHPRRVASICFGRPRVGTPLYNSQTLSPLVRAAAFSRSRKRRGAATCHFRVFWRTIKHWQLRGGTFDDEFNNRLPPRIQNRSPCLLGSSKFAVLSFTKSCCRCLGTSPGCQSSHA